MLIHLSDAHCHVSAHELDDFDSAISSADVSIVYVAQLHSPSEFFLSQHHPI